MAQPIDEYISDERWFEKVHAAIVARDELNQLKEMRRLWSNKQRSRANEADQTTNLGCEEYNEVQPLPVDYEPVPPLALMEEEEEEEEI